MGGDPEVVIVGAGIGGLTLALALKAHCGLAGSSILVLEQAPAFGDGVGGGIGLYANGLRVLRDASPALLKAVRSAGYPYVFRRWLRHDGAEVAVAEEKVLCDDPELASLGIRRWKLQKALCDAATEAGVTIEFGARVEEVREVDGGFAEVVTAGGVKRGRVVFGADGLKSRARRAVAGADLPAAFTGVTCLMGSAPVPRPVRGICFPSSSTTKCHACYYPTGDAETVFQLYFPADHVGENWGPLAPDDAAAQARALADDLAKDGWDEALLKPLREPPDSVIRVGIFARDPLQTWVKGRVFLVGDAAHPPVPYIGQGAMQAMEDVGVLALCLKEFCCASGAFDPTDAGLAAAARVYQKIRVPRATRVLASSHVLGKSQQRRAESWTYNLRREWAIKVQCALYGTLPIMKPGVAYDYAADVKRHVDGEDEETPPASRAPLLVAAAAALAALALVAARRKARA